jgi:L-lactate dehydrogenase (cytochrome)
MRRPLCLADFEPAARRRLPRCIHGYIEGGAEDGSSVRGNRLAFEARRLRTRVLVDTSARSTRTKIFDRAWSAPFGIAPMGASGVAAFQADLALARAAARADIPFVLSGSSLIAMERIVRENPAAWFQAYPSPDDAVNEALVARVAACGFETLVVTVDVPVAGNREADLRNGYASPLRPSMRLVLDGLLHPRWLAGTLIRGLLREGMPHFENLASQRVPMISFKATRLHRRDNLSWSDLARMRDRWRGRLVLKRVLSPEDMVLAREAGVDGVIASNHGGRQLDGVLRAIDLLRIEIDRDMALLGCADLNDLAARLA